MTFFSRTLLLVLALLTATPAFPAGPELLLAFLRPNTQYATTTFDDGTAQGWTLGSGSLATDYSYSTSYAYRSDYVYPSVVDSISKTLTCANGYASFWFKYETSDVSPRAYVNTVQKTLTAGAVSGAWTHYSFPVTAGSNIIRIDFVGTGSGSRGWVDDIKIPIPLAVAKPAAGTPLRTDGHWSVTGLVAEWPFNEGSGWFLTDVTDGTTLPIQASGAPVWTSSGLMFDGVYNYASGTKTKLNFGGKSAMTLMVRFYQPAKTDAGAAERYLLGKVASAWNYHLSIPYSSEQYAFTTVTTSGRVNLFYPATSASGNLTPYQNAWNTLIATYDGAAMKLYLNGTLVRSVPQTGALLSNTDPFGIGCRGDSSTGARWLNQISVVSVYDRALSDTEAQSLTANPWQIFAGY